MTKITKKMKEVNEQIKLLQNEYDSLKTELLEALGNRNYSDENLTVKFVSGSKNKTIDLVKFQKAEPITYMALLKEYPKVSKRAGYARIIF